MNKTPCPMWQRRLAVTAFVAFLLLATSFVMGNTSSAFAATSAQQANLTLVPGHLVPLLKNFKPLHDTQSSNALQLSIGLRLRNVEALKQLIADQNDLKSIQYHHYLTPQEFTQRFGPTQSTVDSITTYLRSQGIRVNSVASNRLFISASTTVALAEKAFGVHIADYSLNGRHVYAPTSEPNLPVALAQTVINIGGLDNVAQYRHHSASGSFTPAAGPSGGYTPSELRTAYDINPLISAGADGSGQTVAIFELDGYTPSDVNKYLSYYNLGSAKYSNVLVDGATNTAGSGAVEVELDMEVISGLAPGATQKIYIGPNTTTGVNDTYNKIVTDNTAKVTSISWGECEASSGNAELSALDNIFSQGAAQGQAFFAASGDSGAYDCNNSSLAVDSPADDPYVTGVGGTNLRTGTGGTYISESIWSNPSDTQRSPKGSGGGGGISTYFSRPGYQTGTNLDNAKREVPDVSADADPASGYSVYVTGSWGVVGGTSAAAPLWAAIALDTNAYLTSQGKAVLGNANPKLYPLYNTAQTYPAFHDVTAGNNLYYSATTGYDNASGIGTPNAWNIARDLAGTSGGGGGGGGTTSQLLSNAGFESGSSSWQESSSGGYEIVDSTKVHSGSKSAYLAGYNSASDKIAQTVTLPTGTTKVTLSYWLAITTQETGSTAYDFFYVRIRTSGGTLITTAQKQSNANAQGWTQYTFDLTSALSSYKGQQVQVSFEATTDSSATTNFFVDDTALNVTK